jgi:chitinase
MPSLVLAAPGEGDEKVFVGYVFGRPQNLNYQLYTHLCHAFLVAEENGEIRIPRGIPPRDLTGEAHKAGVRVLISLGGWGWDRQFAAIVSHPEAEDRYVKDVLAFVDESDYDGIDLDWEYPDTEAEVVGFERLTRRLREGLDALGSKKSRPMRLTMAASSNPGTLRWLRRDFLLENMDWINVMTYDFAGDWTPYAGHNAPLHASSKVPGNPRSVELCIDFLTKKHGMPADRLALGIPLYGRGFPVSKPYESTKNAPKRRVPGGGYRNLHKLLQEGQWTREWDDETKTPWLLSPDHDAVIGYDDVESVRLKTDWAMKQGLRGVFFWEVNGDRLPDGSNPLQEACRKVWEADRPKAVK